MTCRELIDFLLQYVNDELPPQERSVFDGHLQECPSCVAYLQTYRATILLAKECHQADCEPEPLPDALVQAILAAREAPPALFAADAGERTAE